VYGWWPKTKGAATNVPVKIFSSKGIQTMTIDQQNQGDGWVLLGSYSFKAGHNNILEINNTNVNGMVIADAFKFEWIE
jgi:hypothetical protein